MSDGFEYKVTRHPGQDSQIQTLRTKSQDIQDKNHKVKLFQIDLRIRAQDYHQPTTHAGQESLHYINNQVNNIST